MNTLKFLMIIGLFSFIACNDSEEKNETSDAKEVSTDLIKNPETLSDEEMKDQKLPQIVFEHEEFDFGKINQGEMVSHNFIFTNKGEADLVISNAKASCGCTVPYWPKDPIAPGTSDTIKVQFDSKGKSGQTQKSITLTCNTIPNTKAIYLKGEILVPSATTEK